MESGRKGDYFVWDMKLDQELSDLNLYNEAKAFAMSVEQNNVDVKYEQETTTNDTPPSDEARKADPTVKAKAEVVKDELPF